MTEKALKLLNKLYTSLGSSLSEQRVKIQQDLIQKVFEILRSNPSSQTVSTLTKMLKLIVQESEKKGTGGVQPHNAILKGELLTRVIVKSNVAQRKYNVFINVFASTTVWEFRKAVGRMVDLAPRYIEIKTADLTVLDDSKNGHVIAQVGIKSGDIITVRRITVEEEIEQVKLIDPETQQLVKLAADIIDEWFDMYSSEEGVMTPESTVGFIKGSTGESVPADDSRIKGLFAEYDKDKDGKLQREEFIRFYTVASHGKPERVFDNIRMHLIRADLRKMADVEDEAAF